MTTVRCAVGGAVKGRGAWMVTLCLVVAVGGGCGDDSPGGQDAGPDGSVDAGPDAGPTRPLRALLLDSELRHTSSWIDTLDALEATGFTATYRRFYPHLTAADVAFDGDGVPAHDLVVLAAGRAPGNPGSRMRWAEISWARTYVDNGGVLVLATQSGFEDAYTGENDFYIFNRLLEELGVAIRVDKNTVIGRIWSTDPAVAHEPVGWAYPTPLEFSLGYPYLVKPDDGIIAGGMLPTLRVASDQVDVRLRTYHVGYLWQRVGGDPLMQVQTLTESRAAAAVAQVGQGFVAVVPRSVLTITAASAISDKPAMDPDREAANSAWIRSFFGSLRGLLLGEAAFAVGMVHDTDTLFSVAAPGHTALDPSGEVFEVASDVSSLAVPSAPPSGELSDPPADPIPGPRPLPAWFHPGGGRVAYGGLPPDPADMAVAFDEIVTHHVGALMTSTGPKALTTLSGTALDAEQQKYVDIAALAETAGARWFVGDWFNDGSGAYPPMIGAQGQVSDVPAPLNETYWSQVIIPIYEAVGQLAATNLGIAGIHLDLELYSGPVWHHDGWAFSDDTLQRYLDTITDPGLTSDLQNVSSADRLDLLVDRGLLGDYFGALEEAAYELGRRCREAAHAHAPQLEMMVYVAGFPNTWFYHGLFRGLGTLQQPVIVMTYDGWANRATEAFWTRGVPLVHLGGAIVSHFLPTDFDDVLVSLAQGNDGYWYYSFNDFSLTNPNPPTLHGPGVDYWAAVDEANERLE
ncbi:MAG: hypothetical protein ABI333_01655 [bacterium]